MRILVTGGCGLLGSHLVDYLLQMGHSIWVIDNLSTGSLDNLPSSFDQRNFYQVDLKRRDMTNLVMKIARPEVVYHLASLAHEGLSQYCPNLITENNLNASMNVLVSAIKVGVRRFVFTSSFAVYGNQKPPFDETLTPKPVDIYGVNKFAFEQTLEIMSKVYGFEYVIMRPHNVIGSRQNMGDPYRNVAAIFMNKLLQNKQFYIYGDGEQKRAFSDVRDFTPSLAKCGFAPEAKNQIFNIGADKEYSVNQLAEILLEISGKKNLTPIHVPERSQEVNLAWCSNEKSKKILGFEDKTPLRQSLLDMWKWAQKKGFQEPKYLPYLELINETTPKVWVEKMI